MDEAITQLRAIIADEALSMAERREAAAHLAALRTSMVDLDIPPEDPEYIKARTPWPRKTPLDAEIFDLPCFREFSNGLSHDAAVDRCRAHRITNDRAATWRDTSLHHLERIAAIAAYMDDCDKPNFWTVNGYGPERLLALDATGRLGE